MSIDVNERNTGGAYLAPILHPTDWIIPETPPAPIVRAYDENGTRLAEMRSLARSVR